MVQGIVLLGNSNPTIEKTIKTNVPEATNFFAPGPPWELGVLIQAEGRDKLFTIRDRIISIAEAGRTDFFIKPDLDTHRAETESNKLFQTVKLFEATAASLRILNGDPFKIDSDISTPESKRLANELVQLDFGRMSRTLRSKGIMRIVRTKDSGKLGSALSQMFWELSKAYEKSQDAREAFEQLSFQLNPDRSGFGANSVERPSLDHVLEELERIQGIRTVYLRNAGAVGLRAEYLNTLRGRK